MQDACEYASHDLRRGHAKDLQKAKHPLANICAMGQWKIGAGYDFFQLPLRLAACWHCALPIGSVVAYLDQYELEQDGLLEAAIQSDDEEWID